MNEILIILVDDTLEHRMRVKTFAETCTKMRRNAWIL